MTFGALTKKYRLFSDKILVIEFTNSLRDALNLSQLKY